MQNQNEKISRHCGHGPRVQVFYKGKTTLLNRLDPGYPAGRPSGMTTKRAFTLIELLVVVLIIGILSAIAVPQYQKAVEKARAAEALTILDGIYKAGQVYYLANGTYPTSLNDLEIGVNWTGTEKWRDDSVMKDTRSNGTWSLQLYQEKNFVPSVYIGRISGPYAGTGFGRAFGGQKILCVEKTRDGYVYDGAADSYCVKIFGATKAKTYPEVRSYYMP